jgi:type II secretory pathway component PulC
MRFPKLRIAIIWLALLNCGLVALLIFSWKSGQRRVHESEVLPLHTLAQTDLSALNAMPTENTDFSAIRDEAVFHNRRSFYQPPAPSQIIPPPDYELAGTMDVRDGKRVAVVKKRSDQTSRTLHTGDDLDGWRVQSIEAAKVVVIREDQHAEVAGKSVASWPSLVPDSQSPHVAQSGIHIVGGPGPSPLPPVPSNQVRLYRPPPQ